jgi:hypothetical protein
MALSPGHVTVLVTFRSWSRYGPGHAVAWRQTGGDRQATDRRQTGRPDRLAAGRVSVSSAGPVSAALVAVGAAASRPPTSLSAHACTPPLSGTAPPRPPPRPAARTCPAPRPPRQPAAPPAADSVPTAMRRRRRRRRRTTTPPRRRAAALAGRPEPCGGRGAGRRRGRRGRQAGQGAGGP